MKSIKKNNKKLFYRVIEKNTKHSYIKLRNGYLLITKSKRMSMNHILKTIDENFDYYYEQTKKQEENILKLWNKSYKVKINITKKFSYQVVEDIIYVNFKDDNFLEVKKKILKEELKMFLLENEKKIKRTLKINNYYEVPIKLKFLRSKFGSYNVNKNKEYIVLNTFLATLDEEFIFYVLYHEYVHQRVKNHQKEFYIDLNKLYENHRVYQQKIKKKRIII